MSDILEKYDLIFQKAQGQYFPDIIGKEAEVIKTEDGEITLIMKCYRYDLSLGALTDKKAWVYKEIKEQVSPFTLKNYINTGRLVFRSSEVIVSDRFDKIS